MAEATNSLTTTARTKTFLKITVVTWDSLLDILVDSVSQAIKNYCGRDFITTTYTDEVYSIEEEGQTILKIKNFPIITLTSIKIDDVVQSSSIYDVGKNSGLIKFDGGIEEGFAHIKVTYSAGYGAKGALPSDLELACWKWISILYNNGQSEGISNEKIGDYSVSYKDLSADIPQDIKLILDTYKTI